VLPKVQLPHELLSISIRINQNAAIADRKNDVAQECFATTTTFGVMRGEETGLWFDSCL
jgi:hypothetical protein